MTSCILMQLEQSECISQGALLSRAPIIAASLGSKEKEREREREIQNERGGGEGGDILTVYCVTLHHRPQLLSAQLGADEGATLIHL